MSYSPCQNRTKCILLVSVASGPAWNRFILWDALIDLCINIASGLWGPLFGDHK
jgi:hypothetical protein